MARGFGDKRRAGSCSFEHEQGENVPDRVAHGWHKADGKPIQPLSTVHRDTYVDYSHGVRLVRRTVLVDGKARDIRHALHAAEVTDLLSDEGPVDWPTY